MLWLNGRLVAAAEARIDPADRGFLLGDGLFETMRAVDGRIPLLARHLARLRAGAGTLGLPVPLGNAALADAATALLRATGLRDAALRLTLTRGPGPRGLLPPAELTPTLLLAAFSLPSPPPPARAAIVAVTRRNEHSPLSRLKSLGYLDNLLAVRAVREVGADEAILLNTAGRLACAATANLFLIEGDTLLTPPPAEGVLPGITRAIVIEQAARLGVRCLETALPPERLRRADGAFLTSSLVGVRALVAVDGEAVAGAAPHPLAQDLQAAWQAHGCES
ncbi:aminotransferase class IV [Benzoatithermus flavus]|uniref:Probable branched-chain-amino-acid aminotransferase n=1 Tax=Benzoatithermus flavus TaxID=3108223 RepID=A0ABU8XPK6_9PROT